MDSDWAFHARVELHTIRSQRLYQPVVLWVLLYRRLNSFPRDLSRYHRRIRAVADFELRANMTGWNWIHWAQIVSKHKTNRPLEMMLPAGQSTIRLTAIGSSGPDVDSLLLNLDLPSHYRPE